LFQNSKPLGSIDKVAPKDP
jgi:hypothetical protein